MKEYIEKELAKNELNRIERLYRDTYMSKVRAEMASYCCKVVEHLPAADVVEARRGDWEEVEVEYSEDVGVPPSLVTMRCNKCNRYHTTVLYYKDPTDGMNYCPRCGCKMKEDDET